VRLARPVPRPILACGAQLKNTFCLASGDLAFLGPHIGDLDNLETLAAFEAAVRCLETFTGIAPEIIAHDLHPDYMSTRYALGRPEVMKLPVQHHHAHVASVMAEHRLDGPVIGVAFDGTGLGDDGQAWGGEILLASAQHYERLATLRPLRLPGGERALREVWRLALAVLDDAWDGEAPLDGLALFRDIAAERITSARQMVRQGLNSPLAHGAGRYFDALGALGLGRGESRFEGQVALAWNVVADASEVGRYAFELQVAETPLVIDARALVRALVAELRAGVAPAILSARFHNTLVAATAAAVRHISRERGCKTVVLTGGCFQNARLAESLLAELCVDHVVYLHGEIPPGDGGLALGQALVAAARF
jgi:hydrogenase maturation protein HypF